MLPVLWLCLKVHAFSLLHRDACCRQCPDGKAQPQESATYEHGRYEVFVITQKNSWRRNSLVLARTSGDRSSPGHRPGLALFIMPLSMKGSIYGRAGMLSECAHGHYAQKWTSCTLTRCPWIQEAVHAYQPFTSILQWCGYNANRKIPSLRQTTNNLRLPFNAPSLREHTGCKD
jgi:hypothetical protein